MENIFQDALTALSERRILDAERLFREFLKVHPGHVAALNLLTVVLMSMERFAEAEEFISRAVGINRESDVSFYNYGIILKKLNKPDLALEQIDNALRLNAQVPETWNNRGTILNDLQQYERAISDFDQATVLNGNYADAFCNKGKSLDKLKRYDEAFAAYDKALALKPDFTEAWLGRGNVLAGRKRHEEALAAYDKALALKPDLTEAWFGRGNVFAELKRYDEALATYDKALALEPDLTEAWLGRGNVFSELKRYDEAFAAYDRALALESDLAEAWYGRGNVLVELERVDDALVAYDKALAIKADLDYAESARFHAKMLACDWRNFDAERMHLASSISAGIASMPFRALTIQSSPEDQFQCARRFSANRYPTSDSLLSQHHRYDHDRIRVAYLSADFRIHPVSQALVGVFEQHDHKRFETIAISFGFDDGSEMRTRLKSAFDQFIDVSMQSDRDVAKLLHGREIDIAVDLTGYTDNSRTAILAQRPSGIQVNFLGYPATMGADFIDYLIADPTLIQKSDQSFCKEKIVYLPNSYHPTSYRINELRRSGPDKSFTRAELGLPQSDFVFCCFNNNYKITPDAFDIWMRILKSSNGSVLWLLQPNEFAAANLRKGAQARGVSPERIVFARRMSLPDHLARLRLADLFLDTMPYNAHTTANDALWAGVPLLTKIGEAFAGRVAASLLNAVGLPELITSTPQAYEDLAIELAENPKKIAAIRRKLESNRLTTPLFNAQLFTRHLEAAYAAMYERYQAGLPPDHIHVAG